MRVAYAALAISLFAGSAVLGLFFLGSAGLAASGPAMAVAWLAWAGGCIASAVGGFFAVRRLHLPAALGFCVVPLGVALAAANLALRFG